MKCLKIFVFICCFDRFKLIIILLQGIETRNLHQMLLDKLEKIIHKENQSFLDFFVLQILKIKI